MIFAWDDRNIEHISEHGVVPDEAEHVLEHARPPFPRKVGGGKYLVWGQTPDGWYLQVVFVLRPLDDVGATALGFEDLVEIANAGGDVVYVIHAMAMTARMKRQFRRL